jgi:hypothetical protein
MMTSSKPAGNIFAVARWKPVAAWCGRRELCVLRMSNDTTEAAPFRVDGGLHSKTEILVTAQ